MINLNISLPDPIQTWVDAQINSGHYANYSDYIFDLIRRDQQQELISQALIEGENSGESDKTLEDIWLEVKGNYCNGWLQIFKSRWTGY